MTQYYNSGDLNWYFYFCGHDTSPLHGIGPFWKTEYTATVPVTNSAGSSVGTTMAISNAYYSAPGTYVSVSPQMQAASETTHTQTITESPVPSVVHSFDSQNALRGAYIGLGVLGLCFLLALGFVAYLCLFPHRDSDFSSLSSASVRSPLVWAGSRVGGSGVGRRAA